MASRRDVLLQQMGITQWVLGRPTVLQGEVAVNVPEQVRLLLVADRTGGADDGLTGDVLRALMLMPEVTLPLTAEQYAMLPPEAYYDAWLQGEDIVPRPGDRILQTPSLQALRDDSAAKRALWQQICHDEHHFFADAGRPGAGVSD